MASLSNSTRLLILGYGIFLVGLFYNPNQVDHYKVYYIAVLLPTLFVLSRAYGNVHLSPLFWLCIAYICYTLLSSFWSMDFSWVGFLRHCFYSILVVSFIFATAVVREYSEIQFVILKKILVIAAALAAVFSILLWYVIEGHPFPDSRLIGMGRMLNENLTGMAYGLVAIIGAHLFIQETRRQAAILWGISFILLASLVLLTQSRSAIGAMLIAVLILTFNRGGLVLLFLVSLAGIALYLNDTLLAHLLSGVQSRLYIWQSVIDLIKDKPWFGYGVLSDSTVSTPIGDFVHAHSIYLATLRDGGVVGGVIFFSMLAVAIRTALRIAARSSHRLLLSLLVFGMLSMVADIDRLIIRPTEIWLIFWFPLALIITDKSRINKPLPQYG